MRSILFSILTCLMFLNPGIGEHELFPYWLILTPFFLKRNILKASLIIFISTLLIIINCFIYKNINFYITDSLQVLSVFIACIFFKELEITERVFFFKIINSFIWLQCIVMILQYIQPEIQSFTANLFAGRSSTLVVVALTRNNAVTGFSPEPSYGSSLLVGLYFLQLIFSRGTKIIIIPVLFSLLLFKSVYGLCLFYILWMIYVFKEKKYILFTLFINIILIIVALYSITSNTSIQRFILFVNELLSSKSLLVAEKFVSNDSTRLDFLVIFQNWTNLFIYFKNQKKKKIHL